MIFKGIFFNIYKKKRDKDEREKRKKKKKKKKRELKWGLEEGGRVNVKET